MGSKNITLKEEQELSLISEGLTPKEITGRQDTLG